MRPRPVGARQGAGLVWGRVVWHEAGADKVGGKVRLDTVLTVRAGEVAWREGRMTQMGQCWPVGVTVIKDVDCRL